MKNRTLVKLAFVALLLLPSLASADSNAPKLVLDGHVGAEALAPDTTDMNAGGAFYVDAEAGARFHYVDLTAFTAYATKHVDGEVPDDIGGPIFAHYRLHVIDAGARATLHGEHAYVGLGVALETLVERGMFHTSSTRPGTVPTDMTHDTSESHPMFELRGGYTLTSRVDMFGAVTYTKTDYETLLTGRLGIGYRF